MVNAIYVQYLVIQDKLELFQKGLSMCYMAKNVLNAMNGKGMARFTVLPRIVPPKVSVPSRENESFNKKASIKYFNDFCGTWVQGYCLL